MTPSPHPQVTKVITELDGMLAQLADAPPPETVTEIRLQATQYYDSLTTRPHLDNPHWKELHGMVCKVLTRLAGTVPGGGRSRASQE